MKSFRIQGIIASSALAMAMASTAPAWAQDAGEDEDTENTAQTPAPASGTRLQEIVVTAERRETSIQAAPVSVSVRGGEDLLNQGRYGLGEILEDVPNVEVIGGSPEEPGSGIVIRGIQPPNTPAGLSSNSATGYYVDEVFNGLGGNYDISRVEALRGPQGTLYGRSATGGVVSIYTRNPDYNDITGDLSMETGSLDLVHFTGGVSVPIIKGVLAIRASGNHYESDGYWTGEGGYSNTDDWRVKVGFRPTDRLTITLAAAGRDIVSNSGGATITTVIETDGDGNLIGDPTRYDINDRAISTTGRKQEQYYANVKYDFGFANFTYIPAWQDYSEEGTQAIGTRITQYNLTPYDRLETHEARFDQTYDNGLSWVAGVFIYDNEEQVTTIPRWNISGALVFGQVAEREQENQGVFGEITVPLTDAFRITGGLRYDKTKIQTALTYLLNQNTDQSGGGPDVDPNFGLPEDNIALELSGADGLTKYDEITYKGRLEYDVTPDNMLYAMVSSGSLPGDVQATTGIGNQPISLRYGNQKLVAYEVGTKNEFGGVFRLNAAAFYYDYAGYQSTLNIGVRGAPIFIITTSPAEMKGFDLEAVFSPSLYDQFTLSMGYIDAKYTDFAFDETSGLGEGQQRYGDYIPGIAPWTLNGAYERMVDLGLAEATFRVSGRYIKSHYSSSIVNDFYDSGALPYVKSENEFYLDFNARVKLGDTFTITGYVRNVLDKVYKTGGSVTSFGTPFSGTTNISSGRTFGFVASANF